MLREKIENKKISHKKIDSIQDSVRPSSANLYKVRQLLGREFKEFASTQYRPNEMQNDKSATD